MSVVIRMHFDGKVFIPETPVDLPLNESLAFELRETAATAAAWDPKIARAAIRRIAGRAKPVGIALEALRRENLYEDRGA